jgi:hypothetical protein
MSEIEILERHLRDEDQAASRLFKFAGEHFRRANEIQHEIDRLQSAGKSRCASGERERAVS